TRPSSTSSSSPSAAGKGVVRASPCRSTPAATRAPHCLRRNPRLIRGATPMPRIPLRRRLLASALVPLLGLGLGMGSAQAEIGYPDTVPAATLLLPYFAVDLANPNGAQTRFSVINTAAAPTLAKVTLWSNLGIPTFSFDVYLE